VDRPERRTSENAQRARRDPAADKEAGCDRSGAQEKEQDPAGLFPEIVLALDDERMKDADHRKGDQPGQYPVQ